MTNEQKPATVVIPTDRTPAVDHNRVGRGQPMVVAAPDTSSAAPEVPADGTPGRLAARLRTRVWSADGLAVAVFVLGALFVTAGLWAHPDRIVFTGDDEALFEWMLESAARAVTHLQNPLFGTQANVPDGINLMANTSVLGLGIPLTPVTLLFGPHVTFLVAIVLCLAGTAVSWYVVLLRTLVRSRPAAFVGAAFCGFAPGMIAQATGHLNLIAQFLVAPIAWAALRLGRPGRAVRHGVVLGLLVTYQLFLNEEVLLFEALALGLFTMVYALAERSTARQRLPGFLRGAGVTALTASALLAYPLWVQFLGPWHYRGLPFNTSDYALDLAAYGTYSRQTLGGSDQVPGLLSPNPTEENAFFGLALLGLCAVIVAWLWRNTVVKALTVVAVVFAALSLGPTVQVDGRSEGIPGPLRLLAHAPLFDLTVPARYPLAVAAVIGVLLALSVDRVWTAAGVPGIPGRLLWLGAVAAVLLPVTPLPLRTYPGMALPEFVSSGQWRQYVPPGRTVVPVPPARGDGAIVGMFWSARTGCDMAVPGGRFIGPTSPTDDSAQGGAYPRPTALLLGTVADTGTVPVITDRERRQALVDLRYWRGAVVVLGKVPHEPELHRTLDALLGPGQRIGGAWVWDVRGLAT